MKIKDIWQKKIEIELKWKHIIIIEFVIFIATFIYFFYSMMSLNGLQTALEYWALKIYFMRGIMIALPLLPILTLIHSSQKYYSLKETKNLYQKIYGESSMAAVLSVIIYFILTIIIFSPKGEEGLGLIALILLIPAYLIANLIFSLIAVMIIKYKLAKQQSPRNNPPL